MGAKAKHDVAPTIRWALERGLRLLCRKRGKTLQQIMSEELSKDFLGTIQALARWQVREASVKVEGTITHDHKFNTPEQVSVVDSFLEEFTQEQQDALPYIEASVSDRLVLSDKVHIQEN